MWRPLISTNWSPILALLVGSVLGLALVGMSLPARTPAGADPAAPLHGASINATCPQNATAACVLASAGSSWSIGPVSNWCSAHNQTVNGGNGSSIVTSWTCHPSPVVFQFSETRNSTLSGNLSISGSFDVFIAAGPDECLLVGYLEPILLSCAPWIGPDPGHYALAANSSGPETLDFSALNFSFDGPHDVLPPLYWSIWVVDTQTAPETVTVGSALLATPF
jgi:hypothetical protein